MVRSRPAGFIIPIFCREDWRLITDEKKQRKAIGYRIGCQEATDSDGGLLDLESLPILVSDYLKQRPNTRNPMKIGWNPKIKTLFTGVYDEMSPLYCLQGLENAILKNIVSFIAAEYTSHIKLTIPAKNISRISSDDFILYRTRRDGVFGSFTDAGVVEIRDSEYDESRNLLFDHVSFTSCGEVTFPAPAYRNVNCMPFVLGDKQSLPRNLQCYHDCIQQCPIDESEIGSVCYLTVHESFVRAGTTQRRGGLHIESPGKISSPLASPSSSTTRTAAFTPGRQHWGCGQFHSPDQYKGGIYFASNISNTSVVYNALIDKSVPGIIDEHGGCEHLRDFLGPGTKIEAGQLVWMTDRTPHEAVPQEEDGYRQFFRVMTSEVTHWFAQHSTPNPRVPLPDNVIVVEGNKFDVEPTNDICSSCTIM